MKKIGKNTKLYLIGMIIGGITLGITTVIADTIINSTSVSYKTTTVKAALDELYDIADFKQEVKDMLYPVGSIYISVSGTNPSELFGGTWVSFGQGRTLIGTGGVTANTVTSFGTVTAGSFNHQSPEVQGGEYSHNLRLDELPNRVVASFAHPGSSEVMSGSAWVVKTVGKDEYFATTLWDASNHGGTQSWFAENWNGSARQNFNVVQPYVTVYMWKRIS